MSGGAGNLRGCHERRRSFPIPGAAVTGQKDSKREIERDETKKILTGQREQGDNETMK